MDRAPDTDDVQRKRFERFAVLDALNRGALFYAVEV